MGPLGDTGADGTSRRRGQIARNAAGIPTPTSRPTQRTPKDSRRVSGELGDSAVSARRAAGRPFEFQVQAQAIVDGVLLESLPLTHVTTVLPGSRSETPAEWETVYGQVTLDGCARTERSQARSSSRTTSCASGPTTLTR
jgi:hypothetical protein